MSKKPSNFDEWYVKSSYQDFVKMEGVPLYEGSYLEDLGTLPLADWERRGGKVAYTRLGNQEINGLQLVEIPPKGELKPEHHMHVINFFHNLDFIFNSHYVFKDRYSYDMQNFFVDKGTHWKLKEFETNFIPDLKMMQLDPKPEGGYRCEELHLSMASTSLGMHVKSIAEGTYTNAHRHQAGAHVIVIAGEGYELLFMPGEEKNRKKVPTKPYSVIAPKENEFHHHFNTGKGPYLQLAFRGHGIRYGMGKKFNPMGSFQVKDPNASQFAIPYEKEDPSIREEYYQELEKRGITVRLPPIDQ